MLPAAKATQRSRRKPRLDRNGVRPLPPSALEVVPAPVREASEQHAVALARLDKVTEAAYQAKVATKAAAEADRKAAAEATAAGRLPPKPTAVKAHEEAERAARGVEAAMELARGTQYNFIEAANEQREAMAQAASDAKDVLDEEVRSLFDRLEALLVRRRELEELEKAISELSEPMARAQSFAVFEPRRDPLAGGYRDQLDALRESLNPPREYGRAAW
jgi:hypothetical protein